MTIEQHNLLTGLKAKVNQLVAIHQGNKAELQRSRLENADLRAALRDKEEQILSLRQELEMLRLAKAIAGVEEDGHGAKMKINKIVREIDRCIALLNK